MLKLLLTLLLVLSITLIYGDDVNRLLFKKGVKAFNNGEYAAAIVEFKAVQNTGIKSAEVFCNLGNAYFKAGKSGKAMLTYEEGLAAYPFDSALTNNRDLLAASLKIPHIERTTFSFIDDTSAMKILNYGIIAGAIIFFISSLIFASSFFYKHYKKRLIKFCLYSFTASVLTFGITTGFLLYFASGKKAIVLNPAFSMAGPGRLAKKTYGFKAGESVLIINCFNGWYKVEKHDGAEGWLRATDIAIIK